MNAFRIKAQKNELHKCSLGLAGRRIRDVRISADEWPDAWFSPWPLPSSQQHHCKPHPTFCSLDQHRLLGNLLLWRCLLHDPNFTSLVLPVKGYFRLIALYRNLSNTPSSPPRTLAQGKQRHGSLTRVPRQGII